MGFSERQTTLHGWPTIFDFQSLSLPWMLKKIGGRDRKMLTALMVLGYLAYFYYANAINQPFDQDFARLRLSEYLSLAGG